MKQHALNLAAVTALLSPLTAGAQTGTHYPIGDLNLDSDVSQAELDAFVLAQQFTEWLKIVAEVTAGPPAPPLEGDCPGMGVDWARARVVHSGGIQCADKTFSIHLGADEGGQIAVEWTGCPTFIDIEIGHGKVVAKEGYRTVHRQFIPWQRQAYTADCAASTCVPDGLPTELTTTVEHWAEEICGASAAGDGGGPGSGIGAGH